MSAGVYQALESIYDSEQSFRDAMRNLLGTLLQQIYDATLGNLLSDSIGNLGGRLIGSLGFNTGEAVAGNRASGGLVTRGRYNVGEQGREFVVNTRATNRYLPQLNEINSGGNPFGQGNGDIHITNTYQGNIPPETRAEINLDTQRLINEYITRSGNRNTAYRRQRNG